MRDDEIVEIITDAIGGQPERWRTWTQRAEDALDALRREGLTLVGWPVCGTCEGSGSYVVASTRGAFETDTIPCPVCVAGRVPPDGMVEAAAKAMEPLAPNAPLRWYAMARAALVAAAR